MNPINLTGGGEIEPRLGTTRIENDRANEANAGSQKPGADSPAASDSISVSNRAAEIGELAAKADQLPEVRQERVEQLRNSVQAGNYHPSASDIADAILKDGKGSTSEI